MIKNGQGLLVAAKNGLMHGPLDPMMAEAMSCKETLSWLKYLGHNKIVLELDALNVFNALSYFGFIINDCKIMDKDLRKYPFAFVMRSMNWIAHAFARAFDSESDHGK